MRYIYLMGQMSENAPETRKWRSECNSYIFKRANSYVRIIDPTVNKVSRLFYEKRMDDKAKNGCNLITPLDYQNVLDSDGGIFHARQFDQTRKIIGSFFELAWYYANPEKIVIGIKGEYDIMNHPMVKATVHAWVDSPEEAIDMFLDSWFGFNFVD